MNQHLAGTRNRPGTRCGRHSCPNSRRSPARVGLGTIDMGREARPGRYLQPGPTRRDPIHQRPTQSLLTATFGSWWVPFVRRAAFVLATTSSVRESSLVSSSGLLEYAAGQTGVHSLHKRRLPVEEPQLERAGGQRAGARVVRVQGPAPTAAGATARPRWRRSSPPALTGPVGSVRRSGVVSRAGRVDPDAVVGERPLLAPRVPRFTGFAGSRRPS